MGLHVRPGRSLRPCSPGFRRAANFRIPDHPEITHEKRVSNYGSSIFYAARRLQKIRTLRGQKTSHAVAVYHHVIERDIRAAPRHELCAADRSEDSPCPRLNLLRADHFRG